MNTPFGIQQNVLGQRGVGQLSVGIQRPATNYLLKIEQTFTGSFQASDFRPGIHFTWAATKFVDYADQSKSDVPFGYGQIQGPGIVVNGYQNLPVTAQDTALVDASLTFLRTGFEISMGQNNGLAQGPYNYIVYLWGQPQLI